MLLFFSYLHQNAKFQERLNVTEWKMFCFFFFKTLTTFSKLRLFLVTSDFNSVFYYMDSPFPNIYSLYNLWIYNLCLEMLVTYIFILLLKLPCGKIDIYFGWIILCYLCLDVCDCHHNWAIKQLDRPPPTRSCHSFIITSCLQTADVFFPCSLSFQECHVNAII